MKNLYSHQQIPITEKQEFDFIIPGSRVWRLRVTPDEHGIKRVEMQFTYASRDGFANAEVWERIHTQEDLLNRAAEEGKDIDVDAFIPLCDGILKRLERWSIDLPYAIPLINKQPSVVSQLN